MRFLIVIFVCLRTTDLSFGNNSTRFRVNLDFHKKTCKNSNKIFKWFGIQNSLICGSICSSHTACRSIFYFPASFRCDGCTLTYDTGYQLAEAGEKTEHYTTKVAEPIIREGYKFIGCYSADCGLLKCRRLKIDLNNATEKKCLDYCKDFSASSTTFALQGGTCNCGWDVGAADESTCNTPCPGNPIQKCGGLNAVTLFSVD